MLKRVFQQPVRQCSSRDVRQNAHQRRKRLPQNSLRTTHEIILNNLRMILSTCIELDAVAKMQGHSCAWESRVPGLPIRPRARQLAPDENAPNTGRWPGPACPPRFTGELQMTMKIQGYATHAPTDDLAPFDFERREARADDVVIEIL